MPWIHYTGLFPKSVVQLDRANIKTILIFVFCFCARKDFVDSRMAWWRCCKNLSHLCFIRMSISDWHDLYVVILVQMTIPHSFRIFGNTEDQKVLPDRSNAISESDIVRTLYFTRTSSRLDWRQLLLIHKLPIESIYLSLSLLKTLVPHPWANSIGWGSKIHIPGKIKLVETKIQKYHDRYFNINNVVRTPQRYCLTDSFKCTAFIVYW